MSTASGWPVVLLTSDLTPRSGDEATATTVSSHEKLCDTPSDKDGRR